MSAKIYDFNLAANASLPLHVVGSFYKIISCTGAVSIIRDGGTSLGPINAGQGERDLDFSSLRIVERTGSTNIGTILIADSTFVDDRMFGDVNVLDGGKSRSNAGLASMVTLGMNPTAGQYNNLQLWNPAGSGKRIVLEGVAANSSSPGLLYFGLSGVQLLTAGVVLSNYNKNFDFTSSIATSRFEVSVSAMNVTYFHAPFISANSSLQRKYTSPIIINPGRGYTICQRYVNADLTGEFEYYEEALTA